MNAEKNKAKILCVDDEIKNLELLDALLFPLGCDIIFAENGETALKKAAEALPDIVLLDIMMPDISGYEVLKKLRRDKKTQLIPVVMLTALSEIEDRVKALNLGCDDFISKPFNKTELLARVKSLLRINYYRRQLSEAEKFQTVIEEMNDGVIICDPDWKVSAANAAAKKYFAGIEERDVNILDYIFKNYSATADKKTLLNALIVHKKFDIIREATQDFKPLYLETDLTILKNTLGEISGIIFVFRNVTNAKIEETVKRDFLGLISHKLRTPLTIIGGNLSFLAEVIIDNEQKQILGPAVKATAVLSGMLEKLLNFAKIDREGAWQPKKQLPVYDFLSAKAEFAVKINNKSNKKAGIRVDCPDKNLNITINEEYFDTIMTNIIENSVKFNDKETIEIRIRAEEKDNKIEISVFDNGPGIPPEDQEKVIGGFYQSEKYFTGTVTGLGLGLAQTKFLAGACGGEITLESEIGKGTTVIITLPKS